MIARYFAPLCGEGSDGLRDDCAVLDIPAGYDVVVSSDTLNAGVHFLADDSPDNIARKALRTNLSDLASSGARPYRYQLNIAFPSPPDAEWLAAFTRALKQDQDASGILCSGGDTTRLNAAQDGGLSLSITAIGLVKTGQAVRRSGARAGDVLICSDYVGDAALGLYVSRHNLAGYAAAKARYHVPPLQSHYAPSVCRYARACADVSDGLLADALNIATASGVGVMLDPDGFVFSDDIIRGVGENYITYQDAVTGGDDYVLLYAVAPSDEDDAMMAIRENGGNPFVIGVFSDDCVGINIKNNKYRIENKSRGWTHF